MPLVIGLVGKKGSGKETVSKIFKQIFFEKKIEVVRFSDTLAEILGILDLPKSRENLQHLAVVLDDGFGKGTLTHAVAQRLQTSQADLIFLDGIRWPTDIEMLRSLPKNILIYVKAEALTRFERIKSRKEKAGEEQADWNQFQKEDMAKNEIYIEDIGSTADYVLDNNGDLNELKSQIEKISSDIF